MPTSTTALMTPSAMRNSPETLVPMIPVVAWKVDDSSLTWLPSARTPNASRRQSPKTTLECPRENQNPTDNGRP